MSAAINILHLFLEYAKGRRRPAPFRRSNVVDESDVEEEDVVVEVS